MDEYEFLKEYEEKLMYLYAKANTKSKRKKILYDLISFSQMCHNFFKIKKSFAWENDDKLIEVYKKPTVNLIKYTMGNKDIFDSMSSRTIDIFKEVNFDFYKNHGKTINYIPYDKLKEIFISFLNSYDKELGELFLNKFNSGEIFSCPHLENANGCMSVFESIDKTPIFISKNLNMTFYVASVLAHELGHVYEAEISKGHSFENHFIESTSSPYHEVSSQFFKYLFLNYLKENRIYELNTEVMLRDYYIFMLEDIIKINYICSQNNIDLDCNGNITYREGHNDFFESKREEFNYYNITSDNIVNYKDSFIYGLGSLFGIYLYDAYKKDPMMFRKEFKNAMVNYPMIGMEAFRELGITREVLEDGSTLKRVLNKF